MMQGFFWFCEKPLHQYSGALHLAGFSTFIFYKDFGVLHHFSSHSVAKSL